MPLASQLRSHIRLFSEASAPKQAYFDAQGIFEHEIRCSSAHAILLIMWQPAGTYKRRNDAAALFFFSF